MAMTLKSKLVTAVFMAAATGGQGACTPPGPTELTDAAKIQGFMTCLATECTDAAPLGGMLTVCGVSAECSQDFKDFVTGAMPAIAGMVPANLATVGKLCPAECSQCGGATTAAATTAAATTAAPTTAAPTTAAPTTAAPTTAAPTTAAPTTAAPTTAAAATTAVAAATTAGPKASEDLTSGAAAVCGPVSLALGLASVAFAA